MTTVTDAIVIALFDSVWQDAVLAVALWVALRVLRQRSADARYIVSCAALAAMVIWPVASGVENAVRLLPQEGAASIIARAVPMTPAHPPPAAAITIVGGGTGAVAQLARWALPIWVGGVLVFSLRLVGGGAHVLLLSRRGTPADAALIALVGTLTQRMGVPRRVRVVTSTFMTGPATIGVLRPVILMPAAALLGLSPQQIETVVAHELAHIRRHDYLVNIGQLLIETLCFYHPAIWWASNQIRREREVCCDDVVVRCGGDPLSYARALTTLARLPLASPRLAMSAGRAPLVHRIQRLVGADGRDYGPSLWPPVLAIGLLLACATLDAGWAQTEPALRFDVASVKPNRTGSGPFGFNIPGVRRFTATNVSLRDLIRFAYDVDNPRLVGGPDWIRNERFDVNAVADRDIPTWTTAGPPAVLLSMVRSLLTERFKLDIHRETRELPVYALVLAHSDKRLGPRASASTTDCESMLANGSGPQPPPASPSDPPLCGMRIGPGQMLLGGVPMARFATALSPFAQRLVIDRTGLTGSYNLQLSWTPQQRPQGEPPPGAPPLPPIDSDGASLFGSIQEQLGLKLEPSRAPLDVIVIDRVEHPTPD